MRCSLQTAGFSHTFGFFLSLLMLASLTSMLPPARGQEVPRPSQARQRAQPQPPPPANLRLGQLSLALDAGFSAEFVDNVYLTPDKAVSDLILHPGIGVAAIWPLTERNTLRLHTVFSYSKYLANPRLDNQQITLSPDSALELSVYTGDFRINFHDQFAITDETASVASLSGVANLPRFTNTAGVSVLWDQAEWQWSCGYDRFNFLTIGSAVTDGRTPVADPATLDHSTDQFSAVATFITGWGRVGLEATYAISDYPEDPASNFTSLTVGPTMEWQLTRYTGLSLSGGYKHYTFQGTHLQALTVGADGQISVQEQDTGSEGDGYYANLALLHRLNRYYTDHLEIGHEDQVDALSGRSQTTYLRYAFSFAMNSKMSLSGGVSFEDIQDTAASPVLGGQADHFQQAALSLGTGYRLTPHSSVSMGYQYTKRFGGEADRNYQQNRVTLGLAYTF